MYSLKCIHEITEAAFGDLLQLMREAFPDAHITLSFSSAKNILATNKEVEIGEAVGIIAAQSIGEPGTHNIL
ncbi:MAG: hypothetical protein Q8841_02655 [Candidatus Phytoplasma australasiaticum]|nr:hypothetical protein [Candidatus Phytoplasma australasiaticum]